MDIQKEREAFERLPLAELAIESEYVYYNEETNSYWPNEDFCPSDAPETMNFAWEAWQTAKAQAVPEGFVVVPEHAEINLGNGLSTMCDWCDFDSVNKHSWFLVKKGRVFYVATNIRETDEHGKSILKRRYLHRILFKDLPKGMVVDHLNGNGLDNRRSNLRIVSHQQNTRNRSGSQKNSKSGVRGVYWHKQRGKWAACIRHNGKNISLGLYDDLEEAKKSRLSKELEIWDADDTYQTKAMIEAQEQTND